MKSANGYDEQYRLCTPAHRFRQGGRDVYAFSLGLRTLDELLPDRIDDRVVRDANRQLTASHARNIQNYLQDRNDWLLGTLMLGIDPDAIDFQSYIDDDGLMTVGELRISGDCASTMKMFDGQHRRRAIKDALRHLEAEPQKGEKLRLLGEASIPVMLYAEAKTTALQQMFADAAQTKTIERNTVARFDLRDAFNVAALWLEENSDLFVGRVEMERASVSRTSTKIIAINQLAATLKTLAVGYKGRVSKDLNESYMLNLEDLCEMCWLWADDFMPAVRGEYEGLMAGEIDNSEIPEHRKSTLAYNANVIRLLAGCYHEWVKDRSDWKPLANFIRAESLQPGESEGALLVDAGLVLPGGITPLARSQAVAAAIDYINSEASQSG